MEREQLLAKMESIASFPTSILSTNARTDILAAFDALRSDVKRLREERDKNGEQWDRQAELNRKQMTENEALREERDVAIEAGREYTQKTDPLLDRIEARLALADALAEAVEEVGIPNLKALGQGQWGPDWDADIFVPINILNAALMAYRSSV